MENPKIGVEIAVTRQHTSVVVAGRSDDHVVFELVGYLDGSDTAVAVAALALAQKVTTVVVDPRSPASTLITPLRALGGTVLEPKATDLAVAHGRFVDELRAGRLRYVAHPALDAAVQFAGSRPLAGAEAIERRKSEADAGPLAAAELAVWAVLDAQATPTPAFIDLDTLLDDDDY